MIRSTRFNSLWGSSFCTACPETPTSCMHYHHLGGGEVLCNPSIIYCPHCMAPIKGHCCIPHHVQTESLGKQQFCMPVLPPARLHFSEDTGWEIASNSIEHAVQTNTLNGARDEIVTNFDACGAHSEQDLSFCDAFSKPSVAVGSGASYTEDSADYLDSRLSACDFAQNEGCNNGNEGGYMPKLSPASLLSSKPQSASSMQFTSRNKRKGHLWHCRGLRTMGKVSCAIFDTIFAP